MDQRKVRVPIPANVAAQALFRSDRTCCVCHIAGKQVQIHHINDDPSDNHPENLAVLCLECHAQTQISGGFGRKLNAKLVTLYRDHWLNVVEMRRAAESLESELVKDSAGPQKPRSSAPENSPKASATDSTATGDSIGRTFRHLGIAITLLDAAWSFIIYLNNSRFGSGMEYEPHEQVAAGDGAKFVTVTTRVLNDGKESIDLTCGRPVATYLIDERERRFDPIGELNKIPGNPECNYHLQPGFAADMTWIYRVPLEACISAFEFEDATDLLRDRTIRPTRITLLPHPGSEA